MIVVTEAADLTPERIEEIAFERTPLRLDERLQERLGRIRAAAEATLRRGQRVYGVNTGTGYLADVVLTADEQARHQHNLLLGRAVGGPPYLPAAEARAVLAVRLRGLLTGHAAVTPALCAYLTDRINDGFVPAIPRTMIGCAGEVIPLAHAFQTLLGVGTVLDDDATARPAGEALAARGVAPYDPRAKEGLALLAGAPAAAALGVARLRAVRRVAAALMLGAACAIDAFAAPREPYNTALAKLIADPTHEQTLHRLGRLVGATGGRADMVQAPASFRVAPQVLAHVDRTLARFREDVTRAVATIGDSPALVDGAFLPNGGFHEVGVPAQMDAVTAALSHAAEVAAQRLHRLLDGRFSGLPDQLTPAPGGSCGLIVVHKRAVGAVHELRRLAASAPLGLQETSLGQEDAMTFVFDAAERLRRVEALVGDVVACELVAARQAWALRGDPPATGLQPTAQWLAELVPAVTTDRPLGADIDKVGAALHRDAGGRCSVEAAHRP